MSCSRRAATVLAAALILGPAAPANARALTIKDLLRLEAFVRAFPSPDRRRMFIQTLGPLDAADRYDDFGFVDAVRTRLAWVDPQTRRPRLHRLGIGLQTLGWSPSGRYLALGRLVGRRLRLGVLDAVSNHLAWSAVDVQAPAVGPSVAWRSDTKLLALAPLRSGDGAYPDGLPGSERLQRLRRLQAQGGLSGPIVHASGRFARDAAPTTRLLDVDLRRGAIRTVATGAFDDLSLSTSGRYLALSGPASPPHLAALPQISVSDPQPQRRVSLMDLDGDRRSRPVRDLDCAATLLDWSPEGDQLLI